MSEGLPPAVEIEYEPRFCGNHVVDLTAGCSFSCIYCPFADRGASRRGVSRPTPLRLLAPERLPAPASVFLSPASDAFAPQAAAATHELLGHLLPRGTIVGIVTKGIIPERTLDLLERHRDQVEGIAIGVTSLDDARNRILEPGCPAAGERLANIARIARRGLPSALRIDPLFPLLDDDRVALESLVDEAARRGAIAITATYVFAWGPYLRRLRQEPLLEEACALLTEKTPMEGGLAFSVPLARKLGTYSWLAQTATARRLGFTTCGCKDLRMRDVATFPTTCRNITLLGDRSCPATPTGGSREPAG